MKIYNTMTGAKEEFTPLKDGAVLMYVCGLTVYDFMHIGNARTFVAFDAVYRYLLYKGYNVTLVRNYTDIDDRIIKRAIDEGVSIDTISERYINEAETDYKGLSVLSPSAAPRVTREMPSIIKMIETLIEKNYAYIRNGSVFYNTDAFKEYGKLSKKNKDELNAGSRVLINIEKENPADFILWKPSKENEPGWESPWGPGRPGWHIECSVMAKKYCGDTIDIHTGGEDLIFPHHENEIAQSEAANGCTFSRYWMHARHLNINNQKMSKSTGNFFTIREISKIYPYPVIRFFLLSSHYRSVMNFSEDLLIAADNSYNRIKTCVNNLRRLMSLKTAGGETPIEKPADFTAAFTRVMDDDFNTADAISVIFSYVRYINAAANENSAKKDIEEALNEILNLCHILGIEIPGPEEINDARIHSLIEQREEARRNKDFKTSDDIRDKLLEQGIILKDTRQGVVYERKGL